MACLMNYTVQCKDIKSGKTGCFLFDAEHWQITGEFSAVSPVFSGLVALFNWGHENGNACKGCYIERI